MALLFIGISALLSFALPFPWLGFSLAIVILYRTVKEGSKGRGGSPVKGGPVVAALKRGRGKAMKKEPAGVKDAEDAEKVRDMLSKVQLSPDILKCILEMKLLLNGTVAKEEKDVAEIETRDILDVVFRHDILEDIPKSKELEDVKERLRGPVGSSVQLDLFRLGEVRTVVVMRQAYSK